jgi:hypothetical protein
MYKLKISRISLFGLNEIIETVKKKDILDIITYINHYKNSKELYLTIYNKKCGILFDDTIYEFTEQIKNYFDGYLHDREVKL